jgi:PKD repeat protein
LSNWPSAPSREAINADLDELAVYPTALSLGQVRAHYAASGRSTTFPNINPTAAFTSSSSYHNASFDGSTSFDDDGTIVSYLWDFGDGTTGTGETVQHTYSGAGTYTATLTVTDNRGGTNSVSHPIPVTDPPENILPVASFTSGLVYHTGTFTSTSTDTDGTIVSSAWDFGDGTTGGGATVSHTYAGPGTYTVGLTVTDDRGGTNTITQPLTITDAYATDAFGRTVANGFGTADIGGAWTLAGAASSFAVSDGAGHITGAVGGNRSAYLTDVSQTDVDIKSDLTLDSTATGGGAYVSIIGRRVSNNNDYRLKVRYASDGRVIAYLTRTLAGSETILANLPVPGLTATANDPLRARFQVSGSNPTTLRAKVWRQGTQEPAAWTITGTDDTPAALQAPGNLGILLYTSGSWTGAAPALTVDNLQAEADAGAPVNIPPTASFTTDVHDLTLSVDGSGSSDTEGGTIASYLWDFGDGSTGVGATNQHTYATAGPYTVTLTVTDDGGATNTTTRPVTATDPPPNVAPTASFTADVQLNAATLTSTSTDSDGTITASAWDFGDGTTGSGATVQHSYTAAGTYNVTLTVTDDDGDTGTITQPVPVADPPSLYALDGFGRDVANGLGIADLGGAWTLSGAATSFSVAGGTARVNAAAGATRAGYLASVAQSDVDMKADLTLDSTATGGGAYASLVGRRVANNTDYRIKLRYVNDGRVIAYLTRMVGGTETIVANLPVPGLTVTAGDTLRVRFQLNGSSPTTLRAKVWRATDAEPTDWTITGTDATPAALQAPGGIGVVLYTSGSWTGTAPTLAVDNLVAGTDVSAPPVDPPPNVAPIASFTAAPNVNYVTVTSTSIDPDGVIVSSAWDFGDGGTGVGASVQHAYTAGGTYTVTLTVTDDKGDVGTISQPVTVADPPSLFALDGFGRDVANGLGTADLGGAWTLAGAATSFSVSGGAAHIAGAVSGNRAGYLASVAQTDVDLTADVSLDAAATGGGAYVSLIGRRVANYTDYRLKLRYLADGRVVAYLTRMVSGAETILANLPVPDLTVAPGDALRVRLQVSGSATTSLRAKVWRTGTGQPVDWTITGTETTPPELQGPGGIGVLLYTSGSWTGTAPVLTVDDLGVGPILPE